MKLWKCYFSESLSKCRILEGTMITVVIVHHLIDSDKTRTFPWNLYVHSLSSTINAAQYYPHKKI